MDLPPLPDWEPVNCRCSTTPITKCPNCGYAILFGEVRIPGAPVKVRVGCVCGSIHKEVPV